MSDLPTPELALRLERMAQIQKDLAEKILFFETRLESCLEAAYALNIRLRGKPSSGFQVTALSQTHK